MTASETGGRGELHIEVLFFEGCPNRAPALDLVNEVIAARGVTARIVEVGVRDQDDAERLRFPGSPTVRVDGVDIESGEWPTEHFVLGCRLYGATGVPPRELLVAALDRRRP